MFADSSITSLFEINYFIDVFIKHKSKVEFGMGNLVTFPINIYQQRNNIAHIAQKSSDWMDSQEMKSWEPTAVSQIAHLDMIKDSQGKILTKVSKDEDDQRNIKKVQNDVDNAAEMAKSLAKADEDKRKAEIQKKIEVEKQERLKQ